MEDDFKEEASAEAVCPQPFNPGEGEGVLLSLDSGFVRSCDRSGSRHFEVTVGRCERSNGSYESFGFVADEGSRTQSARRAGRPCWPDKVIARGSP